MITEADSLTGPTPITGVQNSPVELAQLNDQQIQTANPPGARLEAPRGVDELATSGQVDPREGLRIEEDTQVTLAEVGQTPGQVGQGPYTPLRVLRGPWAGPQWPAQGAILQTGTGPVIVQSPDTNFVNEPVTESGLNNNVERERTAQILGTGAIDDLPPFPALGKTGGIYHFEPRSDGSRGAIKVMCRWRAVELDRRGRTVKDSAGKAKKFKPAAYCGRWSAEARRGLPEDPEMARLLVLATAEAYLKAQGIEPKKEEKRKGSNKRGQSKRKSGK